jgi:RNA-directed DNA polymerase
MNQEWKFKLHSLYGQLMLDLRLQDSFYHVKKNKGSGGVDGETLETYEANLNDNILSYFKVERKDI